MSPSSSSSAAESLVLCLYAGGTIGMVKKDASSGFAPYPSFLTETLRSQSRFHDPQSNSIFSWSDSVDRYKAWSDVFTRPPSGASTPNPSSSLLPSSSSPHPNNSASVPGSASASSEVPNTLVKAVEEKVMGQKKRAPTAADQLLDADADAAAQTTNKRSKLDGPLHNLHSDRFTGPISSATDLRTNTEAQTDIGPNGSTDNQNAGGAPPFGHPVTVRSSAPKGTSLHHALSSTVSPDGTYLELSLPTLITPRVGGINGKRVRYAVLEYDPLLDSSEMDIPDWIRLAKDISLNYEAFDSFIVLHGTDTMAYTSSALSMLLENLGKTVIVTGAQVPLSELRNDAIENVLGALMLAGNYIIPEVSLYFASTLYRGNRTSKVSNNALAAFDSPNMAPLARVGINIEVSWNLVQKSTQIVPFRAHDKMSPNVALLRLFPGLPTSTVSNFLQPPLQGVVLESYGAGNAPSRQDLLETFQLATQRGLVIVNITQCLQGEVSAIYATGKKLQSVGVVAGGDMTPECALAKLSYLLAKNLPPEQVRQLMARPLRGELTASRSSPNANNYDDEHSSSSPADLAPYFDLKTLLAHILQDPSKTSSSPNNGSTDGKAVAVVKSLHDTTAPTSEIAEWDRSSQELALASKAILPYLIYDSASQNQVALLKWHLSALSTLENLPTIYVEEEHFHPSTIPTTTSSTASTTAAAAGAVTGDALMMAGSSTAQVNTLAGGPGMDSSIPLLEKCQPLHIASAKGFTGIVETLLTAGCSVHARHHSSGHSPLFLAAKNGHLETTKLIKHAGGHLKKDELELAKFLLNQQSSHANSNSNTDTHLSQTQLVWKVAGVE